MGDKEIAVILASPYTRTLQTALPLAKRLQKSIHVEHLLSEANQAEGPFRGFNIDAGNSTVEQLEEVESLWELGYGSAPIATPENPARYVERVQKMTSVLKSRFPPQKGNLGIFTHATTAFSIAYGLCYGESSNEGLLKSF